MHVLTGQWVPKQMQTRRGRAGRGIRPSLAVPQIGIPTYWSLLSQGVAETKRLDLGNLNPIYELNKVDIRQARGRWNVSRDGEGGKGCRHEYPVKDVAPQGPT